MLLGELLVAEKLISQTQLNQALKSQASSPNHSIGRVVSRMYNIPVELIETTLISKSVIPRIEAWFKHNIDQKSKKDGISLSSIISGIELNIKSYVRYEGEAVTFIRNELGYYCEDARDASLEKISLTLSTIKLTTIRKQEILLHDVHIDLTLGTGKIHAENPGFITEARLKLIHALKQTS